MLRRHLAALTASAALTLGWIHSAAASGSGDCWSLPSGEMTCSVDVKTPPTPGNPGGGGGGDVDYDPVVYDGPTVPEQFWDAMNTCVGNHDKTFCKGLGEADLGDLGGLGFGIDPVTGLPTFEFLDPATGQVVRQTVSPAQVAQIARAKIKLPKPTIGSAPCTDPGCQGTVGVPVWLWTDPSNWETRSASATLAGMTVNVNAKLRNVTWSMGDGQTVTCTTPGTRFDESMGFRDSPDCGYRYQKTSKNQPGGKYTIRAVATYDVVFSGAYTGTVSPTTSSSVAVPVGEYQVIVTR